MLRKILKYNCKHIEALLWEYAGGRLLPEQIARVDAHLAHCVACREQLQTIGQIGQGLEMLRQAHVPATQTTWAEVQARLAALPAAPQFTSPARRAVPYRVLAGAGAVAAMALLWVALIPRHSEQEMVTAKTAQNRPSKQNMPALPITANSATASDIGEERIAFEKSFLRKSSQDSSPYLTRPFAPPMRFSKVTLADRNIMGRQPVAWRGGASVRKHHFTGRRGLLLARTGTIRPQQNATAPDLLAGGFTPVVVTLPADTPNYILTGVEADAEPRRPRAYVMDCLSTDAKSQNNDASNRNGEERAW